MPSYFIIGTSRNDKLTERVDQDLNIRKHYRTYLNRFLKSKKNFPPTNPPTRK
jgi:hypothetical protein